MSKASEWAMTFKKRPRFWLPSSEESGALELVAEVSDSGRLNLRGSVATPDKALALARWILDVFGEED
jgi:hypothetical protein